MTVLSLAAGAALGLSTLALFAFGVNLLYLSWRALRLPPDTLRPLAPGEQVSVCVQLPIFNERHVAERIIDAVCRLDWPRAQLEIQVLDDSDDDTSRIVAGCVRRWSRAGLRIRHVRRGTRAGYKAGALAHGMELTGAEFLAIFDADFVPGPGFLRELMPAFRDPGVGFAQARWGHLNEDYSLLTRLQALAIDYHFLIEQAVRSRSGYFTNFTGTAGVWRRQAIADAGGWSAASLTEDLDLSYRAQLLGWRPRYLEQVVVPEELPVEMGAYRRQQLRWATGSFQSARRLLPGLLRSRLPAGVKWQGLVHLLSYGVGPMMLVQLASYPLLLTATARHDPLQGLSVLALGMSITLAPCLGFMAAQARRGRGWWAGLPAVLCQVLGAGFSLTTLRALVRSRKPGGEFERTPKYRIEKAGQPWLESAYARVADPQVVAELALGAAAALISVAAGSLGTPLIAVYAAIFASGFLSVGGITLAQALQLAAFRHLGRRALARLQRAAPVAGLLALAVVLLAVIGQIGDPFEDSYHHWLVAAYLAQTGALHDPLFGMEDTWLPGYHLLAAGLLKVFGLWQMGVLKAASAVLGLLTLLAVYRLAQTPRQGRLAVVLLALNPVFMLTATSVVAEPLTTALLSGGALAAIQRRRALAAAALAGACLTATKAWIWVGALISVLVLQWLLQRRSRSALRPALAWALPALVVLGLMQLAFAPASHSVARAALEVTSATSRGSLPLSPWSRLGEFTGYFALASLPLLLLAPIGLVAQLRAGPAGRERTLIVQLPALAYLGVVVLLVAGGLYTGSHRYYYLALPALALLAAAGLERLPAPAALLAAAGAGVAAVLLVPVFVTFAGENAGLAAAGRASAAVPGRLLTDSPVAAYSSHKPPNQIVGSRSLPPEQGDALAWLREEGITSVVVEDISYYRATSVFPDLVHGTAQAPFAPLGQQSRYQVQAGKPVHAYALDAYYADLTPSLQASLGSRTGGPGKTAPLQKGVQLDTAGRCLSGEGVGFGVPIVHYPDGWVYSGSATTLDSSTPDGVVWRKVYQLDLIERDDPAGRFLAFEHIPSRGSVEVSYELRGSAITIRARAPGLAGFDQVVLLNEQSGAFDDFADAGATRTGSQFGSWMPAQGGWARLRSQRLGLEWSQPTLSDSQLFGAHEVTGGSIDFSGLEYVYGPAFSGADYTINVGRAR